MGRRMSKEAGNMKEVISSKLFQEALDHVVPNEMAMHPQRAAGGSFLLQHVADPDVHAHPNAECEGLSPSSPYELPDADTEVVVKNMFWDSMPAEAVTIDSIQQVYQPSLLKRFLERVAEDCASVEVTFHGTRAEHVEQIVQEGLHPDMCTTGAYGAGAYVGTHSGVAHQYADADSDGRRHMCVILCVCGSRVEKGKLGQHPTATAVDRLVNPTQYCLIDAGRLYVSHVITYKTSDVGRHRVGGGWEDPFQAALSKAVQKAALRRRKKGLR